MKLFIDTANIEEIASALKRGYITGITTNPSLISKEERERDQDPVESYYRHIKQIIDLCEKHDAKIPVSVEVIAETPERMLNQAYEIRERISYEDIVVKIPIGDAELEVVHSLSNDNIHVNCTCCFSESQLVLAAQAGARYVSLFYRRLDDYGGDPNSVLRTTRSYLDKAGLPAEIIAGSIRQAEDIISAWENGAHIVTAPMKCFPELLTHPKTEEAVHGFNSDLKKWMSQ